MKVDVTDGIKSKGILAKLWAKSETRDVLLTSSDVIEMWWGRVDCKKVDGKELIAVLHNSSFKMRIMKMRKIFRWVV